MLIEQTTICIVETKQYCAQSKYNATSKRLFKNPIEYLGKLSKIDV